MRGGRPAVRPARLSTQVLLLALAIIALMVAAGGVVELIHTRDELDESAGEKSLAIASAVAATPQIVDAFGLRDPAATIDPIAERLRHATGATFIVIADRQGIRYSHPDPQMIGRSLLADRGEDPSSVLAGHVFVGVQQGSLGRSMRAKVPIRDAGGQVIGLVSVGVLERAVSSKLTAGLPVAMIPVLTGLALGVLGALLLARRIKRQTFGLEPKEIATLLEQREAMLHGIREGVLTVDVAGRLTLLNDEARRLLDLGAGTLGGRLADVIPEGRVRDVLTGRVGGRDEVVLLDSRVLVASRMPVHVRGRYVGAVVTLRDRTELEELIRELDDVKALADALRAQEHEFSNRLHVIAGLIELGAGEQALSYVNATATAHSQLAAAVTERAGDPVVAALLLGKAAVASERGITLTVSLADDLPARLPDSEGLVTILGNLLDNAFDSVTAAGTGGRVGVDLRRSDGALVIEVHDSGPGVDLQLSEAIFRDGYTTKAAGSGRRRGLGLALVHQHVRRRGGEIGVLNRDGAVFTVTLPLPREPVPA